MVDTSEVFFSNVIDSFVIGARTRRSACGRMIRRIANPYDIPSERAARIWPVSNDSILPRTISVGVAHTYLNDFTSQAASVRSLLNYSNWVRLERGGCVLNGHRDSGVRTARRPRKKLLQR